MTAAVITLAAAVLALGGALAFVIVRRQPDAALVDELVAQGKAELAALRAVREVELQRNEAIAALESSEARVASANQKLQAVERERDTALEEARKHVAERLRSAGVADAARLVDELLQAAMPGVPVAGDPGQPPADDRGGAPGTVPPAPLAGGGQPGRGG